MAEHPLTLTIFALAGFIVAGLLFGVLRALRGPVGILAYGGLLLTMWAYWVMRDRYFSEGYWQISIACLVIMAITLRRVPLVRTMLIAALVEFGWRINTTAYPHQTVLALGVIAAMLIVAQFWTGRVPKAPAAPPPPSLPAMYRRGPELFDPYTGRRLPQRQRRGALSGVPSALWRWTRGRPRDGR